MKNVKLGIAAGILLIAGVIAVIVATNNGDESDENVVIDTSPRTADNHYFVTLTSVRPSPTFEQTPTSAERTAISKENEATRTQQAVTHQKELQEDANKKHQQSCPIAWSSVRNGYSLSVNAAGEIGIYRGSGYSFLTLISKKVSENPSYINDDPSWSPDGTRFVFTRQLVTKTLVYDGELVHTGKSEVWIADADGKNASRLSDEPTISFTHPEFHPDGKSIIFQRENDVWVMNLETKTSSLLTKNAGDPSYSPDGSKVVVEWFENEDSTYNEGWKVINADGAETLPALPTGSPWVYITHISFTPDGEHLAFKTSEKVGSPPQNTIVKTFYADLDGTGVVETTETCR